MLKKLLSWFIKGHVGESSKHMAAVASGIYKAPENTGKKRLVISIGSEGISSKPESVNEPNYPHDVYDFLRCVELVKACPEVRLHFGAIAKTSDRWKKIIDNWDALSSSLNDPDKIHKLMRDIGL
jgi:hypothetical protein